MYNNCRVYGPYKRKDGRKHVVLVYYDGSKQTVSYPKFLMEKKLGRPLKPTEVVHHVDHNFQNNSYANLQVTERSDHARNHISCNPIGFICPFCGKRFELLGKRLSAYKTNEARGSITPFCSKSCASKFTWAIRLGRLGVVSPRPEPFVRNDKSGGS